MEKEENARIRAIRARRAAISPPPWPTHVDYEGDVVIQVDGTREIIIPHADQRDHCNAIFVTNAPTDIDALLGEIDALRAMLDNKEKS